MSISIANLNNWILFGNILNFGVLVELSEEEQLKRLDYLANAAADYEAQTKPTLNPPKPDWTCSCGLFYTTTKNHAGAVVDPKPRSKP